MRAAMAEETKMKRGTEASCWSDLPIDILASIIKLLEVRIDIIRFGSVCRAWRNLVSCSREDQNVFPLKTPFNINNYGCIIYLSNASSIPRNRFLQFYPTSTYLVKPLYDDSRTAFLVKVEHHLSGPHKAQLLNLHLQESDINSNEVIDSRNYHVSELCKMYTCKFFCDVSSFDLNSADVTKIFKKVIVYPDDVWTRREDCVVFAMSSSNKLDYWKFGDEQWTTMLTVEFGDMILYNGKVYVFNCMTGHLWIIEISSTKVIWPKKVTQIALHQHPRFRCDLLKSCGDLYLVEPFYLKEGIARYLRVYKLNETQFRKWEMVVCIGGDRVFILGSQDTSPFSISTKNFVRGKGNRIYYRDNFGVCLRNYIPNDIYMEGVVEGPRPREQMNLHAQGTRNPT
ncbi:F-box protein At2g26160-like [Mercurialis annua]|uniref:F-box protein At2g26160-like n=1 Tax=Mercurialis annua TaxID=3986 RepID=UPI00215EEFBF|nr:F-box protein At2g26160-like [Mercurialis annua]